VALDDVAVTAPDGTALFRTGVLKIFQHDRIAVLGANGVGWRGPLRPGIRSA
jgi:ATPase subunit of ABC transporter with duplicated ATPase domains